MQGLSVEVLFDSADADSAEQLPQLFDYDRGSCLTVLRVTGAGKKSVKGAASASAKA